MDLRATTMHANSIRVPSSETAAATIPASGFAALFSMVEASSADAAVSIAGQDQTSAGQQVKKKTAVTSGSKISTAKVAPALSARKQDPTGPATNVLFAMPSVFPPGFQVLAARNNAAVPAPQLELGVAAGNSEPAVVRTSHTAPDATASPAARPYSAQSLFTAGPGPFGADGQLQAQPGPQSPPETGSETATATPKSTRAGDPAPSISPTSPNTHFIGSEKPIANETVVRSTPSGLPWDQMAKQPAVSAARPTAVLLENGSPGPAPAISKQADGSGRERTAQTSPGPVAPQAEGQPAVAFTPIERGITGLLANSAVSVAKKVVADATLRVPPTLSPVHWQTTNELPTLGRIPANTGETSSPAGHPYAPSERHKQQAGTPVQNLAESSTAASGPPAKDDAGIASPHSEGPPSPFQAPVASQGSPADKLEPLTEAFQSQTSPTGPSSPPDISLPLVRVNSASLLDQMGRSELRLGMRVGDLGSVEIRTQMDRQQLRAEISVEHQGLGHALTAELPSLQQKLHERDLPIISMNLTGEGASGSGSHGRHRNSPMIPVPLAAGPPSAHAEVIFPGETTLTNGLDIHI